jgi:ABC-type sulfate transport system substrate-binding protein
MKKLFSTIIVSCFLLGGNVYAEEEITINSLLQEGYKITKEIFVKYEFSSLKIFTLKKGKKIKICSVKVSTSSVNYYSTCMTP